MNAISGRRAPTSTPPAPDREPRRPEVRRELARVEPALQLLRAAAAEERRPAARRELAVEEDGQPELVADPRARAAARAACARSMSSGRSGTSGTTSAAPIRGCAPSCARRSMRSRAHGDAGDERIDELVLVSDEREDGAVVVGVGVDVEQPRVRGERGRERVDRRRGRVPPRSSGRTRAAAHAHTLGA